MKQIFGNQPHCESEEGTYRGPKPAAKDIRELGKMRIVFQGEGTADENPPLETPNITV